MKNLTHRPMFWVLMHVFTLVAILTIFGFTQDSGIRSLPAYEVRSFNILTPYVQGATTSPGIERDNVENLHPLEVEGSEVLFWTRGQIVTDGYFITTVYYRVPRERL